MYVHRLFSSRTTSWTGPNLHCSTRITRATKRLDITTEGNSCSLLKRSPRSPARLSTHSVHTHVTSRTRTARASCMCAVRQLLLLSPTSTRPPNFFVAVNLRLSSGLNAKLLLLTIPSGISQRDDRNNYYRLRLQECVEAEVLSSICGCEPVQCIHVSVQRRCVQPCERWLHAKSVGSY